MSLLDDLIQCCAEHPVREVRVGAFFCGVWAGSLGLASGHREARACSGHPPLEAAGRLHELSSHELMKLAGSSRPLEACLGIAAINALLPTPKFGEELNAAALLRERAAGKNLAVIGRFPFAPKLQSVTRETWIFERSPERGEVGPERLPELLPRADVVALTATTLVNQSFEQVMAHVRPDAFVAMIGATTPLSPLLFEYGVSALCGSLPTEPEVALREVGQGATFRQLSGLRRVTLLRPGS